jgi:tRNA (cmo5U34)-methyltransferase
MKETAYEDYRVYTESNKVYHELQQTLGNIVRDYASKLDKKKIFAFEVGCGFGDTTLQILRADPRIHLLIAEIDYDMLRATEESLILEKIDPQSYTFSLGDALGTLKTFSSCNFDIFASAQTIHNFPNTGKGSKKEHYNHIARILTPGGLFVNADKYVNGNFEEYKTGVARRMAEFAVYALKHRDETKAIESITRWYEHIIHDLEPERIMYKSVARQQLIEVGFTDIKLNLSKELEVVLTALKGEK